MTAAAIHVGAQHAADLLAAEAERRWCADAAGGLSAGECAAARREPTQRGGRGGVR
jgi:hypothetical protein